MLGTLEVYAAAAVGLLPRSDRPVDTSVCGTKRCRELPISFVPRRTANTPERGRVAAAQSRSAWAHDMRAAAMAWRTAPIRLSERTGALNDWM